MTDLGQTEAQDDSAARIAERRSGTIAHVRIVFGRAAVTVHEIRSTGTTLGRLAADSACAIQIDDNRMSRQHATLVRNASGWQLIDLGSRNGCFVDGRSVPSRERATLGDGAVIRLGDSLMVFRSSPAVDDGKADARVFPGVSPVAVAVRRRIAALAIASGHVLVLGETGTGKERVARAIAEHHAGVPFVTQNCAELTRDFARSELFGHVRGAFSGATHNKVGLVDLAGNGVLFLDEIGELSLDVQGELLRFLEDGTYRPLGSAELKHSGTRVVAATNVDIDLAVAGNKFRRDLAARLRASNAPLELAPLRERREDIPQWTRLFFHEAGHVPSHDNTWTVGALECLLLYPWLENLRELRGVVRTLAADLSGFPCLTERLPVRLLDHRSALRDAPAPLGDQPVPTRRDPTQGELEDALRRTQGSVRAAAHLLGIERRQLYRLAKRFGIAIQDHREARGTTGDAEGNADGDK